MVKAKTNVHTLKSRWESIKEKGSDFANTVKEKGADVAHTLETNPTTKNFWHYLTTHKKEAILGSVMLLGLIFSFYWLGSFVVGLAAGLYASWGLKGLWYRSRIFIREEGAFPTFIIGVAFVLLLFHVFSFVIGGIVGLTIKSFITNEFGRTRSTAPQEDTQEKKTRKKHTTAK